MGLWVPLPLPAPLPLPPPLPLPTSEVGLQNRMVVRKLHVLEFSELRTPQTELTSSEKAQERQECSERAGCIWLHCIWQPLTGSGCFSLLPAAASCFTPESNGSPLLSTASVYIPLLSTASAFPAVYARALYVGFEWRAASNCL
eukprot:1078714-Alexandrium_andersonii.AAC.1